MAVQAQEAHQGAAQEVQVGVLKGDQEVEEPSIDLEPLYLEADFVGFLEVEEWMTIMVVLAEVVHLLAVVVLPLLLLQLQ